jgi:hypothetical protein
MADFRAALSIISTQDEDAKELISYYSDVLKATSASQKTIIRRDQLEPAVLRYLEKKSKINFRRGAGKEPDFVVNWNTKEQGTRPGNLLDIELKAKIITEGDIKIGGAAVPIDVLQKTGLITASQLDVLRTAPTTSGGAAIRASTTPVPTRSFDYLGEFARITQGYTFSPSKILYFQGKVVGKKKIRQILEDFKESEAGKEFYASRQPLPITELSNTTNNLLYDQAASIVKELNSISPNQKLFDYLKQNQRESFEALKSKAKNVLVTWPVIVGGIGSTTISSLKVAEITFSGDDYFNSKVFYMKVKRDNAASITFYPYIKTPIEKRILAEFDKDNFAAAAFAIQNQLEKFESKESIIKYKRRGSKEELNISATFYAAMLGKDDVPAGSIPQGKVRVNIPRRKSSAFTSRTASARRLLRETKQPSMGDFITNDTITALTQREMMRRMPIGPVGGPPLSRKVLTYRTGRFVQSLKVIADMRSQAMQYYYDPRYWIHETTSRNPRDLIDSSLNSVTRNLFSKRFNLVKAERSL